MNDSDNSGEKSEININNESNNNKLNYKYLLYRSKETNQLLKRLTNNNLIKRIESD